MKIIGLDGKEYPWNYTKYKSIRLDCSSLHWRTRVMLNEMFPYDTIYEEVIIPGIKNEIAQRALIADFYINAPKLMVEVQGEQHTKHVQFFHANKLEYFRAKKLDSLKRQWCIINKIKLVELPCDGTDEEWERKIRNI